MRVCRYTEDGRDRTGFWTGSGVVPAVRGWEAWAGARGLDAGSRSGAFEGAVPLDLLPPDGALFDAAREVWDWLEGLSEGELAGLARPVSELRLRTPIARPGKLLLLAGNYAAHVIERGGAAAERSETFPYVFMKPTTTLTDPFDPIRIPSNSPDHVDWECELGVVVGRRARRVPESRALEHVAGYTVVNDVTDRRYRPNPGRKPRERDVFFDWLHGKWHDTFCPMGPCVLSSDAAPDPQDLRLRLRVNGTTRQDGSTGQMVFPVAAVIAFLSELTTLEPGDVVATGTPAGVGSATGTYLKAGDVVEAEIEGIGVLRNPVERESDWGAGGAGAEDGKGA